jgi:hypothetical protein
MSILPISNEVSVATLSRIFDKTSASYKFLLFKSILDCVRSGQSQLDFKELALRSISQAWYAIHFYKISFGKSDRMSKWIDGLDKDLKDNSVISDLVYDKIYELLDEQLVDNSNPALNQYINEFAALVPYRLITPWFSEELRGKKDVEKNKIIANLSRGNVNSLYSIDDNEGLALEVSPSWFSYLKENMVVIEGWWRFKFLEYLQKRNPTVLSLATKLEPPTSRNMGIVKDVFSKFYNNKKVKCFYSGDIINGSISHDHFLPWSFLGSDPLYNFVPTTKNTNSSKSNMLPSKKKYLNELSELQFQIFSFLRDSKSKRVEEYINDLHVQEGSDQKAFQKKMIEFYDPLYLTAKNQGFDIGWYYVK